jgi:hypothetical protein
MLNGNVDFKYFSDDIVGNGSFRDIIGGDRARMNNHNPVSETNRKVKACRIAITAVPLRARLHGDHLSTVDLKIDTIDQRAPLICIVTDLVSRIAVIVRPIHAGEAEWPGKNGAPIAAVRIPIGISAGATIVRASVSAPTTRIAPRSADAGSSNR